MPSERATAIELDRPPDGAEGARSMPGTDIVRLPAPVSMPFEESELRTVGLALSDQYAIASPFPHIVIDGFFDEGLLRTVEAEFPDPHEELWQRYKTKDEHKLACKEWHRFGARTRSLLADLNSGPFVSFLSALTGIDHLVADPYLVGGGLHQIEPGGRLELHADFNRHHGLQLERRLNAIVYLNEDWESEWGGSLEMWDRHMREPVVSVPPLFNRLVVFSTTRHSYHGHPQPLACPPGRTRRSLALYYYTVDRPAGEDDFEHTSIFRSPRGTRTGLSTRARRFRVQAVRFVPPIALDAKKAIAARLRRP